MATDYPSHSGKAVPVPDMADKYLAAAIAKLQAEESNLCVMLAGLDPPGLKEWRKRVECLAPAFTLAEALERTRHWIATLQLERDLREKMRWPEI
jgi:hypothetical protein